MNERLYEKIFILNLIADAFVKIIRIKANNIGKHRVIDDVFTIRIVFGLRRGSFFGWGLEE